jgi:hypothetical protein
MAEKKPLSFDQFWGWLQRHPNCILRLGAPDAIVHDHDDHHWSFGLENDGTVFVQMARGKRSVAEVFIDPREIAFVTVEHAEGDEHVFQLRDATEKTLFYFAMTHEFDEAESQATHHWN